MKDGMRFELKLSPTQRAMLDELARQTGISVSDLVRLGVHLVTNGQPPITVINDMHRRVGA